MKNNSWFLIMFLLIVQFTLPSLAETIINKHENETSVSVTEVVKAEENILLWKKRTKKALKIIGYAAGCFTLYLIATTCFLYIKSPITKEDFVKINIRRSQLLEAIFVTVGIAQTQLFGIYLGLLGAKEVWSERFFEKLPVKRNDLFNILTTGIDDGIRCIEKNQKPIWKSFNLNLRGGLYVYFNPRSNRANYDRVSVKLRI